MRTRAPRGGPRLGAHVPTAGGLARAPQHGRELGAAAIQVFTRNQVQWQARPVAPEEAAAFRQALGGSGVEVVVAHGSYLVNLASPDPELLQKSRAAFRADLERCQALGIGQLIFHPGAHMGAGEEAGLQRLVESLDAIVDSLPGLSVQPTLEVTAGQGSCLGHSFDHLALVLARARCGPRLGVCLDTCHLLAAGYDIASEAGFERVLEELDQAFGLRRVTAFHLNDARQPLGSRLDRHAAIGEGHLGRAFFRRLVRDPRFFGLPMVLETPSGLAGWKRELALLRRWARAA